MGSMVYVHWFVIGAVLVGLVLLVRALVKRK
jgi:hypothetical protein